MKIDGAGAQPTLVQQTEKRDERRPGIAKEEGAKPPQKRDVVDLSFDAEGTALLEAEQAERVEALKARVAAGTYEVDSRAVAEKMLARGSGE